MLREKYTTSEKDKRFIKLRKIFLIIFMFEKLDLCIKSVG